MALLVTGCGTFRARTTTEAEGEALRTSMADQHAIAAELQALAIKNEVSLDRLEAAFAPFINVDAYNRAKLGKGLEARIKTDWWAEAKVWLVRVALILALVASIYVFGFWPVKAVAGAVKGAKKAKEELDEVKTILKKTTVSIDTAPEEAREAIKSNQSEILDTEEKATLKQIRIGGPV